MLRTPESKTPKAKHMPVSEWAEKHREITPYLDDVADWIQEPRKVVVKKHRDSRSDFDNAVCVGVQLVKTSQLVNPNECEPWFRQIVEGFKKQANEGVRVYPISTPCYSVEFDEKKQDVLNEVDKHFSNSSEARAERMSVSKQIGKPPFL